MKTCVECSVESNTIIEKEINYTEGDFEYCLIPNDKGLLISIKIIKKVTNPEQYKSSFTPAKDGKPHTVFIGGEKKDFDEIIDIFQILESAYSLEFGIKKIHWDKPRSSFIPENAQEGSSIQILSSQFWQEEAPERTHRVTPVPLINVIKSIEDYKKLKILLGFHREGKREFGEKRYIPAFYNFYFVIEGLFGNGKSQDSAIQQEFMESKELDEIITTMITNLDVQKKAEIVELLKKYNKTLDKEGIIHLLVRIRGDLHHFNPQRVRGTPFNHKEFRLMAWFALGLSIHSSLRQVMHINRKREGLPPIN